jgi:hypothetical protein
MRTGILSDLVATSETSLVKYQGSDKSHCFNVCFLLCALALCDDLTICRSLMPVDYLLHQSAASTRAYAKSAVSDGTITYSLSSVHDDIQKNWIYRIYDYLQKVLPLKFVETSQTDAEFRISVENLNHTRTMDMPYNERIAVTSVGDITWRSGHNQAQYGGVQDQLVLAQAIGRSLGLSYPDDRPFNPEYDQDDTLMSYVDVNNGLQCGHTIIYTKDDVEALQTIFGPPTSDPVTGAVVDHRQRIKEDLLIGLNGVVDNFFLEAKGVNYKNKGAITQDGIGRDGKPMIFHNDYNIPSIANFNPYEGDRIFIKRELFIPNSPISPGQKLPKTINPSPKTIGDPSYASTSKVSIRDYLKGLRIKFIHAPSEQLDEKAWRSSNNLIYNDAGKLLLNTNGKANSLGPYGDDLSINGQLVAFVDVYGDYRAPVLGSWFSLF